MSDADTVPEISDTLGEGAGGEDGPVTKAVRWFLVEANRWLVAGALTGFVFVTTVLVGAFGPVSVRVFLTRGVSPGAALVELLIGINRASHSFDPALLCN